MAGRFKIQTSKRTSSPYTLPVLLVLPYSCSTHHTFTVAVTHTHCRVSIFTMHIPVDPSHGLYLLFGETIGQIPCLDGVDGEILGAGTWPCCWCTAHVAGLESRWTEGMGVSALYSLYLRAFDCWDVVKATKLIMRPVFWSRGFFLSLLRVSNSNTLFVASDHTFNYKDYNIVQQ